MSSLLECGFPKHLAAPENRFRGPTFIGHDCDRIGREPVYVGRDRAARMTDNHPDGANT